MKMADGGFRPAYNGQFTTDTDAQVIVGVEAVTVGSDSAQLTPMREQVVARDGQHPAQWLVDGGYATHEQIEPATPHTTIYAPVPNPTSTIRLWIWPISGHFGPWWRCKCLIELERVVRKRL
jgi:hypothetical protein